VDWRRIGVSHDERRTAMSIERVFYCDWRECERHVRTPSLRPSTFLTVTEGAGRSLHFCSWGCFLRLAAEKPPAEVVPIGEA
jgi:hypothetical protein